MKKMKGIGVLTSGGDSPGMNAAVRAVVRMANFHNVRCFGIYRGYEGLIRNDIQELGPRSVSNIVHRGGTILKTSRSHEFTTARGLQKARLNLESHGIEGLIVIGGNGTYRGAMDLGKIWKGCLIGVPGTIDNDLYGTDATIGYDTAVNTALEAIDKVRDTAEAHERFFLIEVMGRHAGFISLDVGIGGGAEEILLPETHTKIKDIHERISAGIQRGKSSSIIVVAEGDEEGGAFEVAKKLEEISGRNYKVVVLGHIQRGGTPTASDRRLASELGAFAVTECLRRKTGIAVGRMGRTLVSTPLKTAVNKKKPLDPFLLKILPALSL